MVGIGKVKLYDKSQKLGEGEVYNADATAVQIIKKNKKAFPLLRRLREEWRLSKAAANSILGKPLRSKDLGYLLGSLLGEGGFGRVYECWKPANGKVFAMKQLNKAQIEKERLQKAVLNEMIVMEMLRDCVNIIRLHEAFEDKHSVYFVLDYCGGGDVLDRIMMYFERNGLFTEAHAAALMRNMLWAVKQCHDNNVVHRDIKPENFLVLQEANDEMTLKLTDFGLATVIEPGGAIYESAGTPLYVAPEVWDHRPYGKEVDMWALGVCLTVMLCGRMPYTGETLDKINAAAHTPIDFRIPPWRLISDGAVDLVRQLLEINPNRRLTVDDALRHPWVRENGIAPDQSLDSRVRRGILSITRSSNIDRAALRILAVVVQDRFAEGIDNFHDMDEDGDGYITYRDWYPYAREAIGPLFAERHFASVFSALDSDSDGRVSLDDFILGILQMRMQAESSLVEKTFELLDLDGDGYIEKDELRRVLEKSGDDAVFEIDDFFGELDLDGDNRISLPEFVKHWTDITAASTDDMLAHVRLQNPCMNADVLTPDCDDIA